MAEPSVGDFVYLDPPRPSKSYPTPQPKAVFPRHDELARKAYQWGQRGAYVLVSNAANPAIAEMYKDLGFSVTGVTRTPDTRTYPTELALVYDPREEWD